jgi:hypothetical protein
VGLYNKATACLLYIADQLASTHISDSEGKMQDFVDNIRVILVQID